MLCTGRAGNDLLMNPGRRGWRLRQVRLNYKSPTSGPGMAMAYRDWAEGAYAFWNRCAHFFFCV